MALSGSNSPTPTHVASAARSAASAIGLPKSTKARAGDDAEDFAASLRSARDDAHAHDEAGKDDDGSDGTTASGPTVPTPPTHATPGTPDPAGQSAWQQLLNPALNALAARTSAGVTDAAADAVKGVAGKLLAGRLAAAREGAAADLRAAAAHLGLGDGKGDASATDALAAGAAATAAGADNAASGTKDSLMAFLPDPDPSALVGGGAAGAAAGPAGDLAPAPGTPGAAPAQAMLDMPPTAPTFAPALGKQIEVWMKDGVQHAEVQLNPVDLGPVRVRIAIEGDQTKVEMAADVQSTRDALQQAMPQLADALGQVGLSLGGAGVSDQPASQSNDGSAFAAFADDARRGGGNGSSSGSTGDLAGSSAVDGAAAAARTAARRGLLDAYA